MPVVVRNPSIWRLATRYLATALHAPPNDGFVECAFPTKISSDSIRVAGYTQDRSAGSGAGEKAVRLLVVDKV